MIRYMISANTLGNVTTKVSLPTFISLTSDNFLSNENLIQDLNNTYLLSLKDTSGLSEKCSGVNLRDDSLPTPIESFETFVDFSSEVKDKLTQESAATINTKTANVCKVLRNSIIESHVRNSVQFTSNSTERLYNPVCVRSEVHTQIDALKEHALAPWNFDKLPGSNPQSWPVGLDTLNERLKSLPELNFFYEPFDLNESFKTKSKQFVENTLAKIKKEGAKAAESEDINHLVSALDAILTISFHTGSFHEIMSAIKLLNDISEDLAKSNISITEQLHKSFSPVLEKIKAFAQETTYLHHLETFCDEGGFKIPKMTYFQKQSFFNTSVATDGAYIYIYVSSSNGGMYKIGTGEHGTTTGRIYAFAGINKTEEVSWVFCKGKLYLRNSSKEMGTLEIVCPNTFKVEGCLQIYCPDIFGHPSLQLINRNYPLLTDGDHVYIIGKKLLSEKINNEPKPELQAQKSSDAPSGEVKEDGSEGKKEAAAPSEKKEEKKKSKKKAEKEEEPEKPLLAAEDENIEKEDIGSKSDLEKSEPSLQFLDKVAEEKPAEEKPAEEKPVEAKPEAEAKPIEQKSEEPKPVEVEVKAVEPNKAEGQHVAAESKPAEEKVLEPKVEEEKSAEEKVSEVKPVAEKSAEEKVAEEKAPESKPAEAEKEKPKEGEKEKEKKEKDDSKKAPQRKDIKKEPRKKKELKKLQENEPEQTLKLCEFILYEFDITDTKGLDFIDQSETYDKELIQELYESFNGYFTFNECARALNYNKDDIQNAAQWLVDEGDRERSKKTVLVKNTTLLAQAEVTSDISTKHLKNNVELITKDDSVIFPNNVSMNIWTMNKTHVALYCESGIKVFSKDPKDVHVLSDIYNDKEADKNQQSEFRFNPANYSMPPREGLAKASGGTGFGSGFGFPPGEGGGGGGLFGSTTSSSNNTGGAGLFGSGSYSSLFGGAPNNPPSFLGTFIKQTATTTTASTSAAGGLRIMKDSKEFKGDVDAFKKIVQDQLGEIPDEGKETFEISQKISHLSKDPQDKYEPPAFKVKEIFKAAAVPAEKAEKKEAKEVAAAPAKVEKKINVELKGTYIKTFDKHKKSYYNNQNFHICYDPYNKRFYTFTWAWDAHTNIFPSLITLTYDPERYQTSKLHHITLTPTKNLTNCTLEDYANKLVEEMLILQKSRFFLPHRLRNWDYLYGWALTDIHNKKGMLGSSNEDEKKKITAQKAKLQQRLAKVAVAEKEQKKNEDYKPLLNRKLIEVKKEYAFSMDGSLDTLKIIVNMLKTKENVIEQSFNDLQFDNFLSSGVYPYLNLLSYWIKHADILINYQEKEPAEVLYVENFLHNILSHEVNTAENLKKYPELQKFNILCWRMLVNGWELLVRTSQKQFKWLQLVIQSIGKHQINVDLKDESNLTSECLNQDGYSPLIYLYYKFAHYPDNIACEFPLKDFQIQTVKAADIFDTAEDKQQLNITRRSQVTKVRENNFVEPYGRLLIEDLSYLEYVKAYSNQFEDLYNSYFINENQEALKIEKPIKEEEEPKEKAADGLTAKQGKKTTKKPAKEEKETTRKAPKEVKTEGIFKFGKDAEIVKKYISIDKDIRYSHEESSRKFLEILEKALCDAANSPTHENVLLWKILLRLVYDSWNEYEKIEEGECEWKHKTVHSERIFSFLERVLDHYSQKFGEIQDKTPAIAAKLIEYISTLVSSLSYLIYQSAVTKNFGCEEIAYTLIRIYSKLTKFMEFQDEKGKRASILEHIITHNDEGIDYLNEKVLETNHPYERGRGINFDPLIFPGAVAISVEFDKRCQSDVSHDFISLSSGYDLTYSNIGYFMNHREAIGTSFRISGKPNLKKPLVMLGNCLQVDFTPSGQVKDEHSLNRWGFKLKVRPIYGVGNYIVRDTNYNAALTNIQTKFGGEKAFTDFVTALAVLNLLTIEIIELHVKGTFLSDHEKQLKKYLKWNLFKGGFSGVELSQLLTTKNGNYYARGNKEYQDLENYTFDDKFEALKEEIYLRIAKYNSKKDTNKENEEKIGQELFNLKDPLLSSFVSDIKEQKGNFLEFVNKLRQIVPIPMMLKAEKMRKTFSDQYKLMWEQAEGYMLLAFLHHSGLLKFIANENNKIEISAEPYITDQLNQLGQKRNEVFNWMLNQIQSEREWQHTLEEISEFRNKYLDEKAKVEEEKNKKNEEETKKQQEKDTKEKEKKPVAAEPSNPAIRSTAVLPAKKGSKISVRPSSRSSSDFLKASKTKPAKTRTKYAEDQAAEETSKKKKDVEQEEEKTFTEDEEEEKSDVEVKPSKDSLDFEEKLDEIILKELSSRFEGHSDALRMVCSLKNIDLNKDSSQLLRDLYEICKSNLKEFKKDPKNNHYILEFKSPYEIVAQNTIETSLFLVKLNSPFKKDESSPVSPSSKPEKGSINEFPNDEDDDDDLKRPNMHRSLSSAPESQISDTTAKLRLKNLRELVNAYQQWKEWHKKEAKESDEYYLSEHASPLKSVVSLITAKLNSRKLELCLKNHVSRASQRIIGLQMASTLFDNVINTPFERYLSGLLTQVFAEDHLSNVNCAPQEFSQVIEVYLNELLGKFLVSFNNKMEAIKAIKLTHLNSLFIKTKGVNSGLLKWKSIIQQSLSGLSCNLRDIIAIISNLKIFKRLLNTEDSKLQEIVKSFFENVFLLTLLGKSLTYLSLACEHLVTIANNCNQLVLYILFLLQKLNHAKSMNSVLEIIADLFKKEIGLKKEGAATQYQLNARVLQRAHDIIVIERLQFLLTSAQNILEKTEVSKLNKSTLGELAFLTFTLTYHHNAPALLRPAHRLAQQLSHYVEFNTLSTPYDISYYYYQYADYENMQKALKSQVPYKFESNELVYKAIDLPKLDSSIEELSYNNALALIEKVGDKILMKKEEGIHMKNIVDNNLLKNEVEKARNYSVLVHLGNEEDLSFLLKVLYYWEEKHPSFTLKYPKTVEEYHKYKEHLSKKEAEKVKGSADKAQGSTHPANESYFKDNEKIFANLPHYNLITKDEEELPIAWMFNMLNNYSDCKIGKFDLKKSKTRKTVRKVWNNANLNKLEKKMEEAQKTIEEFKEEDTEEAKLQIIAIRSFIWRIQQHLKEVLYIAAMLNIFGFSPILESMPFEKATELANLITLGMQKKLKNIPVTQFEKEEIRKKLDPHSLQAPPQNPAGKAAKPVEPEKDQKSEMRVSFVENRYVSLFETNMDFITGLNVPKESLYVDCNKIPVIHAAGLLGPSTTILVDELINYTRSLLAIENVSKTVIPQIQKVIDIFAKKQVEELTSLEKSLFIGITAVIGGWTDMVKPGANISYEGVESNSLVMTQGGQSSGKKTCSIISKDEPSLVAQTVPLEKIHPQLETDLPSAIKIHPRAIIKSFKLLHEYFDKQKDNAEEKNIETSILLRAILRVSKALDWCRLIQESEVDKDELTHFLNFLLRLAAHVPADHGHEHYENIFGKAWQYLIDKREPKSYTFFFPEDIPTEKLDCEVDEPSPQLESLKKRQSQGPIVVENLLPNSQYISSLPEYQPLVSEYKMLKYWEKHIIPKIQDFVRSSYKPYEFEEFFEQLRQPLRKGDHNKAAEIAYILCDQRLPNGCVLPDANHDWSTVSIEEIVLGTWAIASINNKQNKPLSPFFQYQHRIGNKDACVYLIASDTKSSSVLANYYDHENLQVVSVWLPVACVKLPETPLDPPAASFSKNKILEDFRSSIITSMAFLARGTILKFFSFNSTQTETFKKEADLMRSYSFSVVNLIKWSVLEELAEDPLEGWLHVNEWEILMQGQRKKPSLQNPSELINEVNQEENQKKPTTKLQALKGLIKHLAQTDEIEDILSWLKDNFLKLVEFINMNASQFDLQRPYSEAAVPTQTAANRNIYYLNNCLPDVTSDDSIAALTVSFKKESQLCMHSGIKFYDDPKGVNMIQHLPAGKEVRTKLPSLLFKQSKVWFSYYFNSEAIPPYLLDQCHSTLQAVVHAIPSRWSVCLWTADALSTAFLQSKSMKSYEHMKRLISIVMEALQQFQGPMSIENLIFKFLNRCARKMRYLVNSLPELKPQIDIKNSDLAAKENFRLLNVDVKWLKSIIEQIKRLREYQSSDLVVLYSSFTQELIEYVTNCLLPVGFFEKTSLSCSNVVKELNIPDWLGCIIDTALFLQFFKGESELTEDLLRETINNMKLDSQWDKVIYIEDLPLECTKEEIINKIKEIILANKGRILNLDRDIFFPTVKDENGVEKHVGKCLVLLDGRSTFELEDEEEKEKEKEEEEPEKEEEEEGEPELWSCPTCTLENARESPFCDACETPKPAFVRKPPQEPVEEQVKHTDLAEMDQKLKQKEKESLDKIGEQIKEFANEYYEKLKAQLKELEEKEKAQTEKQQEVQQNAAAPVEQKAGEADTAEARKEKNKKKKQELKDMKKKAQEEKQQKRQEKKKGKGKKDEKKEEAEPEEQAEEKPAEKAEEAAKEVVPENKEQEQAEPQPAVEEKKEVPPTPEQIERKRLEAIIANQKKPVVLVSGEVATNQQSQPVFQEFLKKRLFASEQEKLVDIANKTFLKIFNQLKQSASRLIPQYQKSIQEIDISDISSISSDDFIARIAKEASKNPQKVWRFLEICGYDLWYANASFNLAIEAQKDTKLVPIKALEQLMNFLQIDLCKENKSVLNYPPSNIRILTNLDPIENEPVHSINYDEEALFPVKYGLLSKYSLAEVRYSWALIKTFNKNLAEAIDFISTYSAIPYNFEAKWFNLGTYLSAFRNLWMTPIKIELSQKIMHKTAIARDHVPKVTIERLKNVAEKEKQTTSSLQHSKEIVSYKIKEEFIFTKSYEQLKDVSATLFRPVKPGGSDPFLAFEVIFKGELAMGEAGPYRQFFADISQELQPNNVSLASQYKNLNLLVPSPNNYAKLGEGRDNFVINPSAKTSYHLQLYEFLGILMGCSVRTGTHLTLDLPTLFWKQLVNQPITIEDLEEVDKPLTDLVRFMGECTKEVFEESFFENYVTMLSDKSLVELKPAGAKIRVKFEDRFDYISRILHVRVTESKQQIDCIRRGLTKLVPLPFLNIISANDLEIWVCGKSKVDIPLLQRHTKYSGSLNEESPSVKFLWEVLKELSDIEKLRFVKFCWGQERLPANDEEFERTQTRFMIKPSTLPESIHDRALPKADTCFFNLELPKYSTKPILKEKLLLAINTDCDSINADQLVNLDPNAQYNRGNDFEEIAEDEE